MDNLKRFLKILQKYQFWAICGAMVLVAIACWWWATSGLAGQFQKRKSTLAGEFSGVAIAPNHPNQGMIAKIHEQQELLKRGVYGAWEVLYREQKQKNQLPEEVGEVFKLQFENLKPKQDLSLKAREDYRNRIQRHFPALLKLVDVRRPADELEPTPGERRADNGAGDGPRPAGGLLRDADPMLGGGLAGRMPGAAGRRNNTAEQEWIGTVDWNAADIGALESRFDWKETPSTQAVVVAQEDLWVIEALLRVIANTNEGATYATAAVKQIQSLQIGKDAVERQEEGFVRASPTGGGGAGDPGAMAHGVMGAARLGGPGLRGPGAGSGEENDDQRLTENRYVDDKGKPLSSTPESEFKLMPIRMNLVIDQRRLPKLLVECANSNMPIEVKRVRILKSQGNMLNVASGASGGAAGPGLNAMGRRGGGFRGAAPQGFEGAGPASHATSDKQESGTVDVPVEIYGVICIYNPPDREKLGAGAAAAENPAPEAAPARPMAPPAARGGPPNARP